MKDSALLSDSRDRNSHFPGVLLECVTAATVGRHLAPGGHRGAWCHLLWATEHRQAGPPPLVRCQVWSWDRQGGILLVAL